MSVHPPLQRSQDQPQRRGRSKQVPDTARARKASEDRRSRAPHHATILAPVPLKAALPPPFLRSPSPSPPSSASMSPDYWDSPPSPPRSLEDQVHIAYADDNYHLAKVLLLRLKGIHVTDDDDPRIAQVQDEDFDFCFVPNGPIMDDRQHHKAVLELQRKERAQVEECRRLERLRACQRKWEEEKRRMREERLAVLQRREKKRQQEEDRRHRADDEDRRRQKQRAEQERAAALDIHKASKRFRQPKIVNYQSLNSPSAGPRTPFVYDFPNYTRPKTASSTPSSSSSSSLHSTSARLQPPSFDDARAVPFADVLKSMQGPLFPRSHDTPCRSRSRSRTRRLLEALLVDIEYDAEERRMRKGKQRAQPLRKSAPCLACNTASPSSSPISSSSSIPRTSSWLSFRGAKSLSASSSTTDLTTPSSSPAPSPKPWFARTTSDDTITTTTQPPPPSPAPPRHSCVQHTRLSRVPFTESPLYEDTPVPAKTAPISYHGRERSTSTVRAARDGAGVLHRMSKFVELAKGLQTAYASAALFAANHDGAMTVDSRSESPVRGAQGGKKEEEKGGLVVAQTPSLGKRPKLRPAGYRVSRADVAAFLDPTLQLVSSADNNDSNSSASSSNLTSAASTLSSYLPSSSSSRPSTPKYIPLTSPFPPSSTPPPHTVLPDPLPYKLHFKPVQSPCRSPFRFHALSELHTMYPSSAPSPAHRTGRVTWRIRSVGNPVHVRLKALHNVVRREGMGWDGIARETALGGGRERVVGVAYEGLGRTGLCRVVGPE